MNVKSELFKYMKEGKKENSLVENLCYLVTEKGLSYTDLFGETITGEIQGLLFKKKIVLKREGVPIPALIEMLKFQEKILKEQAKANRKGRV